MQHAAAVRAELLAEEAEVRGIADGSMPVPPDSNGSDVPLLELNSSDSSSIMIRSMQQEVLRSALTYQDANVSQ